jgi:hypothetical protein
VILAELPLLSDSGTTLITFAQNRELCHDICYRHIREGPGPRTFVAAPACRLLFTGPGPNIVNCDAQQLLTFNMQY